MTRRPRIAGLLLAITISVGALAPPAAGQVVRGSIRDAASDVPLGGTIVSVLVESGARVAAGFSDDRGTYALRIPGPGSYRVRVERIGYDAHTSSAFSIATGETVVREVRLVPKPQVIATVNVAGERHCAARSAGGMAAVSVWEDLRAALGATVLTSLERQIRLRYETYKRTLDVRAREVHREAREGETLGGMIFTSIPPDDLAREGYVVSNGREVIYRGLDAHVILAPSFLESHCFTAAPKHATNDSLVGLAFEPIPRRGAIDVRGTLWLNRWTRELASIDFTYDGLSLGVRTTGVGGQIEFDQLASGRWIVRRWSIRMPRIERRPVAGGRGRVLSDYTEVLVGYVESGGEVLGVASNAVASAVAATAPSVAPRVTGTIHDSSSGRALAGARIGVLGTTLVERTDERGTFILDNVPSGDLTLDVTHPRLDSLGVGVWSWHLPADTATTRLVSLALPSLDGLLSRLCRGSPLGAGEGVITGRVRADAGASPVAGANVRVSWLGAVGGGASGEGAALGIQVRTGSDGSFVVCNVPLDSSVRVDVTSGGFAAGSARVRVERAERWRRLDVDLERGETDR
jgi:hypothetical protein